jgi:hypothetical protein
LALVLPALQKHLMLGKIVAGWLVTLTLSPFTAPFPTCDLTMFFAGRALAPVHGTSQATLLGDASLSPALPLCRPSGRGRFIALSESRTAADGPSLSAAGLTQSIRPVRARSDRVSLTILRI